MNQVQTLTSILLCVMAQGSYADENSLLPLEEVVAIDVLLTVEDKIAEAAMRANRRLHSATAESFVFDSTHIPHISVLHAYVERDALSSIYAVVDRVAQEVSIGAFDLAAGGYDLSRWEDGTLVNITIEKSPELSRLQAALVQALSPYFVARGDEHAFARGSTSSRIDEMTIDYVATFAAKHTGDAFKPHITVGLADRTNAHRWESGALSRIVFQPAEIAVYQLGNRGTARRELHVARSMSGAR